MLIAIGHSHICFSQIENASHRRQHIKLAHQRSELSHCIIDYSALVTEEHLIFCQSLLNQWQEIRLRNAFKLREVCHNTIELIKILGHFELNIISHTLLNTVADPTLALINLLDLTEVFLFGDALVRVQVMVMQKF